MVAEANIELKLTLWREGLTQRAFAAELGMHEQILSQICTGRLNATTKQKRKIAAALGRSVAELF